MAIIASTLARIKSDSLSCLGGTDRVNEHFAAWGHVWRERVLDPAATPGLFILQVLHGNTAIAHLRHLSRLKVSDSSYCEARKRLPLAALEALIERVSCDCIKHIQSATDRGVTWLGRRVHLADATAAAAPDTPALQELWPQPSSQKSGCGFPVIKLLGLLDLASGMILHLTMMSLHVHEMSQMAAFGAALRSGDILLADRGFCSFVNLAMLSLASVDAVFRMHQRQIVDFTPHRPHRGKAQKRKRKGMPTSRFVRRLGPEDQIVEWVKPASKPNWMSDQQYAQLPATLLVREIRYHITTRGHRTRVVTIATTLLNPLRYPKHQIARLYGLRWEIETNFRHLKQTMGMEQLKCKSVQGVLKELVVFVLVYNLVRAAMTLAAQTQGVEVSRISFIDTIRWLCSRPDGATIDLAINPLRPGRWQPRVKKRRMKEYDLMTRPRREYAEPSAQENVAT
jgi:hypothetical protein